MCPVLCRSQFPAPTEWILIAPSIIRPYTPTQRQPKQPAAVYVCFGKTLSANYNSFFPSHHRHHQHQWVEHLSLSVPFIHIPVYSIRVPPFSSPVCPSLGYTIIHIESASPNTPQTHTDTKPPQITTSICLLYSTFLRSQSCLNAHGCTHPVVLFPLHYTNN